MNSVIRPCNLGLLHNYKQKAVLFPSADPQRELSFANLTLCKLQYLGPLQSPVLHQ